jgi:hypothetical protein
MDEQVAWNRIYGPKELTMKFRDATVMRNKIMHGVNQFRATPDQEQEHAIDGWNRQKLDMDYIVFSGQPCQLDHARNVTDEAQDFPK